jgi:poly(A) polymerase
MNTAVTPVLYEQDQHSIKKHDIDEDARKIVYRLQRAGYKAYVVGGGVRDLLLGKTPKDFDISTDALPSQIRSLFRNCRIIGRRFKLAHIFFANGKTIEVSTFRDSIDPSESGETALGPITNDNLYGTEATDAIRRDLTINGLFLDVSSMTVIDYVDGMHDLRQGIVRIIGDPATRFAEDPVRMLRAVRHSARSGFRIEDACWEAILQNASLLVQSSQVRIFDELRKDVSSGCFLSILSLLGDTGLLEFILPELLENNGRLLSAESDFSLCLERIDDMVQRGAEMSATTVLAIIALFIAGDSIWLRDLVEDLPHAQGLSEHLQDCFTSLTVPRKERERIQMLIQRWIKVRTTLPEALKPGAYKRLALLPDLLLLLEITQFTKEDGTRLHALKSLLDSNRSVHDHQRDHQRPRERRRF